ncbi:MAG: right-handed parallel beta-helix repeat-containing protein [Acidobacteriota bacterium]|nr:right-handed parallel beta-helix repeat-containing protein [Acidobacteriota bacterium]
MRKTAIALFITTTLLFATSAFAGTWYVATAADGGNDSNTGTSVSAPLLTIAKGVSKLTTAGDTLYVRRGTYNEFVVVWSKNGSSTGGDIVIKAYGTETPVVDVAGVSYTGSAPAAFAIDSCSYITVEGFEVRNGPEAGIRVRGSSYVTVRKNTSHGNQSFGIVATTPSANTRGSSHHIYIDQNTVYDNVRMNSTRAGGAWTQGIGTYRVDNAYITGNTVYENWGEGIDCVLTAGCTISGNTAWDNYGTNIYLDNATNANVDRNFCMAGKSANAANYTRNYSGTSYGASGIAMANETYTVNGVHEMNPLNSINIRNNIAVNGKFGISYGNYEDGGGLHNTLIANNTFYGSEDMCMYLQNGTTDVHDTTTVQNNIFYARTGRPHAYATSTHITYGYNDWYNGNSGTSKTGPGDITSNPLLVSAGSSTATSYQLQSTSPCINMGTTLTAVTDDYWGQSRGTTYDIGADEYVP